MDRYVVIGNPVSHSKSPLIHTWFAEQTGQDLQYTSLFAEKDAFSDKVKTFFAEGGKGANITLPFKGEAFDLAAELTAEASTAGAVNTLYLNEQGGLCGHNTDGTGLVCDIRNNHDGSLAGKSVLILGAGGAARGILQPFIQELPDRICIANRTVAKAEALAAAFGSKAAISACGFDGLQGESFDWVINATSASIQGNVPDIPTGVIGKNTWCYDLMYSDEPTPFCRWAKEAGAGKVVDGLGMLVEQAAESFMIWRGVRPQTREVIARLRRQ